MLEQSYLEQIREYAKNLISYGRYKVNGVHYQVPIHRAEIKDDKIYIYLLIDHNTVGNVEEYELFDHKGQRVALKPDSIEKNAIQGILVRFGISIKEV